MGELKEVNISEEEQRAWVKKKIEEEGPLSPVSNEEAERLKKAQKVTMDDAGEPFLASEYWDWKAKQKATENAEKE